MTKIELNRLLGNIQVMKGLYESGWDPIPDCGLAEFLKVYVSENWEALDYEKIDLIIEAHTLTALPNWQEIEVNFTALVERARIDG